MSDTAPQYAPGTHPSLPPPPGMTGPVHWIKANLFSGPVDTVLTLVTLYLLYLVVPPMLGWATR